MSSFRIKRLKAKLALLRLWLWIKEHLGFRQKTHVVAPMVTATGTMPAPLPAKETIEEQIAKEYQNYKRRMEKKKLQAKSFKNFTSRKHPLHKDHFGTFTPMVRGNAWYRKTNLQARKAA